MSQPRIALIGVPTNSAGKTDGVARAPAALRQAGLLDALSQVAGVYDAGDVAFVTPSTARDPETGIIAPDTLASMVHSVDAAVSTALAESRFPLVLGGDCPLLLGCLSAARRRYSDFGLLFVDGHEDGYPPHESTSGEAADMELGLALGQYTEDAPASLANLLPLVSVEAVALVGIRDSQAVEAEGVVSLRQKLPVQMITDQEILAGDVVDITLRALDNIDAGQRRFWLHTDLDVLSTEALPAVDYQQPGGLNWELLTTITALALQNPSVVGWDVTIYNPDMDPDGTHAQRIVAFIEAAMMRSLGSTLTGA